MAQTNFKKILFIFGLLFLASFWTIYFFNRDLFTLEFLFQNINDLNNFISQNFFKSLIFFIFFYLVLVVCNFPAASILSLIGGFLFGTWIGSIGIILGGVSGSFTVFLIAKFFFQDFINKKILNKYPQIPKYFKKNDIELMLLIRLIPGIPFFAQNLILAALGASNKKFFITTSITLTPWAIIFASIGQGLDEIFYQQKPISINLILQAKYIIPISIIIGLLLAILIYKKKFNK